MPFANRMLLSPLGASAFELMAPLEYEGRDEFFLIPRGFVTDFASVPRLGVWLIPRFGKYTAAAVLHDYLCVRLAEQRNDDHVAKMMGILRPAMDEEYGRKINWVGEPTHRGPAPAGPRDTDGLFRRVMRELDVPWLLRWMMWTGVRWGAVFNPARRAGVHRDLPKMLPFTLLALVLMLPASVGIAWGLALFWLLSGGRQGVRT